MIAISPINVLPCYAVFVFIMLQFLVDSCNSFTHIVQGFFTCTGGNCMVPRVSDVNWIWVKPTASWISNRMPGKVWNEITYPLSNFNSSPLKFGNGHVIASHIL